MQNGDTPLHEAALYGHAAVVELLIGTGAKVDAALEASQRFRCQGLQI